jgi:hypothetical protein
MAAELKRQRRENEILRQELPWPKLLRSSLEPTTAFFAKEGSR